MLITLIFNLNHLCPVFDDSLNGRILRRTYLLPVGCFFLRNQRTPAAIAIKAP